MHHIVLNVGLRSPRLMYFPTGDRTLRTFPRMKSKSLVSMCGTNLKLPKRAAHTLLGRVTRKYMRLPHDLQANHPLQVHGGSGMLYLGNSGWTSCSFSYLEAIWFPSSVCPQSASRAAKPCKSFGSPSTQAFPSLSEWILSKLTLHYHSWSLFSSSHLLISSSFPWENHSK